MNRIAKLLYFSILILLASCYNNHDKVDNKTIIHKAKTKTNVKVAVASQGNFRKQIFTTGYVKSANYSPLYFKKSGILKRIYVKNGDFVDKGSVIAKLSYKTDSLQLKMARHRLNLARIEKNNLMIGYNFDKITEDSAKQLKTSLELQSGYPQALTALAMAKDEYKKNFCTAPFTGFISGLRFKASHKISSGEQLCLLLGNRTFNVTFYLTGNNWASINKGQNIKIITSPSKDTLSAQITSYDLHVSTDGLVQVKAVLKEKHEGFLHNMKVSVVAGSRIHQGIVVPKEALVHKNGQDVVFTAENNVARWNKVLIIDENKDYYLIGSGLNAGDSVIISNNLLLDDGAHIHLNK